MECKYLDHQLYVGANGQYRHCCVSLESDNPENIATHTPMEWYNSVTQRTAREKFARDEWPDACIRCKISEENGVISQRQKPRRYGPGISHLDLRFGNSCNLKCISCWNVSSSSIAQEELDMISAGYKLDVIPLKDANTNWATVENLEKIADLPIHEVYLTGGEPMMVKHLPEFLERLDPDTQLRFNTNCTLWNPKIEKILRKFKTVIMSLSLDATDRRIEYIRYGSDWKTVEENANKYMDFCNVDITPTLSVLNAWFYDDIREYAYKKNWRIYENVLLKPDWLRCLNAPEQLKKLFQIDSKWFSDTGEQHHIEYFKKRIKQLDSWRKINIRDYLPQVADAYGL